MTPREKSSQHTTAIEIMVVFGTYALSLKTHAFIRHIHVKATLEYELKLQDNLALVGSIHGQTQDTHP